MAFGSGCATVEEPSEVESQELSFFSGRAGSYKYVIWRRKVTTTKTEKRGMSLDAANAVIVTQGDAGNSPKATSIGGGGWNVSYIVTVIGLWTEVVP